MANRVIKPTVANTTGMDASQTKIGTDCKNARVVITNVQMNDEGSIHFIASYFWNLAAKNTYDSESAEILAGTRAADARTVVPWRQEGYRFAGDPEGAAPKTQAVNYLLTQPQFSNGFET